MEMITITGSSSITAIGYEPNSATLRIQFTTGTSYEYFDVPQYVYDELMSAGSKGTYANANIYKVYRQARV